jgi:hypothetical protein
VRAVVVGGDHELAAEPRACLGVGQVEPLPAPGVGGQVAGEASRGEEAAGRLGMIGILGLDSREFRLERLEHRVRVVALALCLLGVAADHVAPPSLTVPAQISLT